MEKPRLSFLDIFNMSFGFFGIQFGFALQGSYVTRIFESFGATKDQIPMLWIAAPLTGLIVQPIIGYMSDRTWTPLGRRKPYFLVGALLSTAALVIYPMSSALWMAAGLLWVLDASINISMEPFRALVADKLPEDQRNFGFSMQSMIIGLGAFVASGMSWFLVKLGVPNEANATSAIPPSVRYSFYIGGGIFLLSILYSIFTTKEDPPEDMEAFEREKQSSTGFLAGLSAIWKDFLAMPKTMMQLGVVQFFTWFGLFAMWTFATPAITRHLYHAAPKTAAYENGADWLSFSMGFMHLTAAVIGLLLPLIAQKFGRKGTHIACMLLGALGFAYMYFLTDPSMEYHLIPAFVLIGIAWASILAMPYAMLSTALPPKKMGIYMGIFNFFIVIPQIFAAGGLLNSVMEGLFGDEMIWAMVVAGISFALAGLSTFFVRESVYQEESL